MNKVRKEKMKSLGMAFVLTAYLFTAVFATIATTVSAMTGDAFTLLHIGTLVLIFIGLMVMFYYLVEH